MAARPRTLPAAIAPVLVGTAAAVEASRDFELGPFCGALVGSVFIQIGTNLANDYSDARRGADDADRLGPVRVTSSGLVAPRRVLVATWLAFAVAIAAGAYLAAVTGPEILVVGAVSILAGVLYTGGPRPYGYEGLGELFVFLFFGLVAVNGSYYVQLERLDWFPLLLSIPVGLLSAAILVVNNLRDIETDRRAGKRTLAVRIGRERTRTLYAVLVCCALVWPLVLVGFDLLGLDQGTAWTLIAILATPVAIGPWQAVMTTTDGPSLNRALAQTGVLLGAFSALLAAGLLIALA
jgi:1,4-dihydroxy-2-naphthoate polyprenyltransferase